jgi:hypothetical protein
MIDMVNEQYHWGVAMDGEVWKHLENYNGEPHESWVELAEKYKQKIKENAWDNGVLNVSYNKARLEPEVLKDATKASKPFKQIEVPLGQLCYDRYRGWL